MELEKDVAEMVKRLREVAGGADTKFGEDSELMYAAAALLAKLGQEWIPVSERLPEDDITVLFYDAGGVVNKGARRYFNHDMAWIADDDADGMPHLDVTHWMPLPPAPGASDE